MNGRQKNKGLLTSMAAATTPVARSSLPDMLWNWHSELGILALVATITTTVAVRDGLIWLAVLAVAVLAVMLILLSWLPARRRIIATAWCLITPHRVRVGCAQAWVQTRNGRLPVVIRTNSADYGEQVLLWCRAGITPRDLAAAREVLAVACWATDVRVLPHRRYPHLVRLEIIRNQPSRTVVPPPRRPSPEEESEESREDAGITGQRL
jgi:hypothetical protein